MRRTSSLLFIAVASCFPFACASSVSEGSGPANQEEPRGSDGSAGGDAPSTSTGNDAGNERDARTPDAPGADTAPAETWPMPTSAPSCDLTKPFGAPSGPVFASMTSAEGPITLSPDERIAFASFSDGIRELRRANTATDFSPAVPIASLAGPPGYPYMGLTVSADGLTLVIETYDYRPADLLLATRSSVAQSFGAPTPFYKIGNGKSARDPYLRPDGKEILFKLGTEGQPEFIHRAPVVGGVVGASVRQTALNEPADGQGSSDSSYPVVSYDGLTLYFNRYVTPGGRGIWIATRPTTNDDFANPKLVSELTVDHTEIPRFLSADGCRLYFLRGLELLVAARGK